MKRTESSGLLGPLAVVVTLGGAVAIAALIVIAAHLGNALAGNTVQQEVPANPLGVLGGLVSGDIDWTGPMTGILVAVLVVLVGIPVGLWAWLRIDLHRKIGARTRVDYAAKHMGRGQSIAALSRATVREKARKLGAPIEPPGLVIGLAVATGQKLWASWEDMWLVIAGPRTGKTTRVAIGTIAAAPGAVIVTSNKPDIVTSTRALRASEGRVWVFNPQEVTTDRATWWWNPLSTVVDDVSADRLARHFADGSRQVGARADAFFDGAGIELLKSLLLAAALGQRPITTVALWLNDPDDREPLDILSADGEFPLIRSSLQSNVAAPARQRAGVYATAQQMSACLTNSAVAEWVCRQGDADYRPEFNHRAFATSRDTVYSLSREGSGSAGPLVLALTAAIIDHAVKHAAKQPSGRLDVPIVTVLDEAANVCRWRDLPDFYSHLGSHGVLVLTILQSWSQGVDVWTESGMKKLWSAANVKAMLGGVGEMAFLKDLSDAIGDREILTASVSSGRGQSVSRQRQRDRILDPGELQSLPESRAIVLASQCRPVLAHMVPWWEGPYAAAIRGAGLSERAPDPLERPMLAIEAALTPAEPVMESTSPADAVPVKASSWTTPAPAAPERPKWTTPAPERTESHR